MEKDETLEALALPIAQWLLENCNPYKAVIISANKIVLVDTELSIPVKKD